MAKKPQDPPETVNQAELPPEPQAPAAALPTIEDAKADLAANPGRDAVLSDAGWVVRDV